MTKINEIDLAKGDYLVVLDHGFVGLKEVLGSDESIEQAARVSYGKGTRQVSDTEKLIRYLVKHKHTSPIEMGELIFHIKLPIFVMRQLVRHRTANLNEYSGRYSIIDNDYYVPEKINIQKQSKTNKQGREEDLSDLDKNSVIDRINENSNYTYEVYDALLNQDVAKELSRIVLPVNYYTEIYWKCDLKNFLHMIKLRTDSHAQWEIQQYARAMYHLAKVKFPITCKAWEDYDRDAATFSKEELSIILCLLDEKDTAIKMAMKKSKLTKREQNELLEKLNMQPLQEE